MTRREIRSQLAAMSDWAAQVEAQIGYEGLCEVLEAALGQIGISTSELFAMEVGPRGRLGLRVKP